MSPLFLTFFMCLVELWYEQPNDSCDIWQMGQALYQTLNMHDFTFTASIIAAFLECMKFKSREVKGLARLTQPLNRTVHSKLEPLTPKLCITGELTVMCHIYIYLTGFFSYRLVFWYFAIFSSICTLSTYFNIISRMEVSLRNVTFGGSHSMVAREPQSM